METADCFASVRPARCLALLPVAIGLAANSSGSHTENVLEGRFENPLMTFYVAGGGTHWTRGKPLCLRDDSTRYGTTDHGIRWLLLSANGADTQTIGRTFTMGATYHLALACADVFGHREQRLIISVSGGAVARAIYAIPANKCPDGELFFVNCGLDFTPFSTAAVTIRLAHSTDGAAADDLSLQTVPARAANRPGAWATTAGIHAAGIRRFLPG